MSRFKVAINVFIDSASINNCRALYDTRCTSYKGYLNSTEF